MKLASALNLSKPALTKMANKMQQKGYIVISMGSADMRKKTVELSEKAYLIFPKFERIWDAGQKAVKEMLTENPHFISALHEFEKQQNEQSFKDRALKHLKNV